MLKGKLKLGLFGIAFAPLAVAGAVRLAKPAAAVPDSRRLRQSEARAVTREARWTGRRNRFYDVIGGAPHLGSKRDEALPPK